MNQAGRLLDEDLESLSRSQLADEITRLRRASASGSAMRGRAPERDATRAARHHRRKRSTAAD